MADYYVQGCLGIKAAGELTQDDVVFLYHVLKHLNTFLKAFDEDSDTPLEVQHTEADAAGVLADEIAKGGDADLPGPYSKVEMQGDVLVVVWEDSGDAMAFLADVLQRGLAKLGRTKTAIVVSEAYTCSRMLCGAYGGTRCIVTAAETQWPELDVPEGCIDASVYC